MASTFSRSMAVLGFLGVLAAGCATASQGHPPARGRDHLKRAAGGGQPAGDEVRQAGAETAQAGEEAAQARGEQPAGGAAQPDPAGQRR